MSPEAPGLGVTLNRTELERLEVFKTPRTETVGFSNLNSKTARGMYNIADPRKFAFHGASGSESPDSHAL